MAVGMTQQPASGASDAASPAPVQSTSANQPLPLARRVLLRPELKWFIPFLGAVCLMVHFWRIGYAPSLSLGDLGTVLGAFVMFSMYALTLTVVVLLVPAAFLGYWTQQHVLPPPQRAISVSVDSRAKALKSLKTRRLSAESGRNYDAPPPLAKRRLLRSPPDNVRKMMWELPISALVALGATVWLMPHANGCALGLNIAFWTMFSLGMLVVAFGFIFPDWMVTRRHMRQMRRRWVRMLLLLALYSAFWPILLSLLLGAVPTALDEAGWPYLLMAIALLIALHFWSYGSYRKPVPVRAMLSVVGLVMVVVYSQLQFSMIDSAVNRFGLGMMRNVDLIVTREGCNIVTAVLPGQKCEAVTDRSSSAYRINRVDVFSRIGPDFLIGPAGGISDSTQVRFTLPADEVLSWSRAPNLKASLKECGR